MKTYYANVDISISDYFEEQAEKHGAIIIKRILKRTSNGEEYYYYLLKAADGTIDSRYEIILEEDT